MPHGLTRCSPCGEWRGEALLDALGLVVAVSCRCDNDNRCARCMELLADRRLNAWSYLEDERKLLYLPAFAGLDHSCGGL